MEMKLLLLNNNYNIISSFPIFQSENYFCGFKIILIYLIIYFDKKYEITNGNKFFHLVELEVYLIHF